MVDLFSDCNGAGRNKKRPEPPQEAAPVMVMDIFEGGRWIEVTVRWNGERYVEVE